MQKTINILLLFTLLLVYVSACSKNDSQDPPTNTGPQSITQTNYYLMNGTISHFNGPTGYTTTITNDTIKLVLVNGVDATIVSTKHYYETQTFHLKTPPTSNTWRHFEYGNSAVISIKWPYRDSVHYGAHYGGVMGSATSIKGLLIQ